MTARSGGNGGGGGGGGGRGGGEWFGVGVRVYGALVTAAVVGLVVLVGGAHARSRTAGEAHRAIAGAVAASELALGPVGGPPRAAGGGDAAPGFTPGAPGDGRRVVREERSVRPTIDAGPRAGAR